MDKMQILHSIQERIVQDLQVQVMTNNPDATPLEQTTARALVFDTPMGSQSEIPKPFEYVKIVDVNELAFDSAEPVIEQPMPTGSPNDLTFQD